jgi:catechol 2,3-dioxygenase-like lactoylglutathione lyase family enzyme
MRPRLVALELDEDPAAWAALGFDVRDGTCRIAATSLRLRGGGGGIAGWTLAGVALDALDGLPTALGELAEREAPRHPNGVVAIDHVVVATPDTARTYAALREAGIDLRGVTEAGTARRAFGLLADALVEVVGPLEPDGAGPASFWGLTVVTEDLDAAAALLGERLGAPRDAVQPGRRIATVRGAAAGIGTPVAFMTPRA